ncbi:hypothetical protein JHK84_050142 [Glycine max]|uniref:Uncharacterized protein n=1 Tax=Glycine max TaxID=3847 RepID=A0A0R0FB02_SOYBN|nr:hypothetical protein JHK86_050084 [Glycine max]KAG5094554.1 hypothetical protein JHK84_050142 [Glycine max]KAH1154370.1 hypothetical protein GYH30_049874 [Glycine max]
MLDDDKLNIYQTAKNLTNKEPELKKKKVTATTIPRGTPTVEKIMIYILFREKKMYGFQHQIFTTSTELDSQVEVAMGS